MSSDNDLAVLAVLGDPDSDRFVDAPREHAAMSLLKRQASAAGEKFYCAKQLGGCGQEVHVVNGTEKRPHFRHFADDAHCPLIPALARDIYTHRAIQKALVGWLHGLGYSQVVMEKPLGSKSRVDVHCAPDAVIEVQLSNETDESMLDRTARYGGNVTWLFDPSRPITSRDAALERDELVMLVRLDRGERPVGEPPIVEVGIRTVGVAGELGISGQPGIEIWKPLQECTFTPGGGVQHPGRADADLHLATAKQQHKHAVELARDKQEQAEKRAEQQAAEDRAQRQADALERYRQQTRQLAKRREAIAHAARSADNPVQSGPAVVAKNGPEVRHGFHPIVWSLADLEGWEERHHRAVPVGGVWVRVLRYHHDLFPRWAYGLRDQWAAALPEDLLDPAWATLYLLSMSPGGQVRTFVDVEVDPDGVILQHLQNRGLVSLYGEEPVPLMLRRNQPVAPDPARPLQHPVWNAY